MKYPEQEIGCTHVKLAQKNAMAVEYCSSCRVMHVQLEFLTIKFKREAFAELAAVMRTAEEKLGEIDAVNDMIDTLRYRNGRSHPPLN